MYVSYVTTFSNFEEARTLDVLTSNATITDQMKFHLKSKKTQRLKFAAFLDKNREAPYTVKRTVWQAALLASMMYSCDTWLCSDLRPAESVYNGTLKQLSGVRETTCTDLTLVEAGENGAKHLIRQRQINILESLLSREGSIHAKIIRMARNVKSPMGKAIDAIIALNDDQDPLRQTRLTINTSDSTRRIAYRNMNPSLDLHPVYASNLAEHRRLAFTRIRLSSHHLTYERGRWSRTPPEDRRCLCGETQTDVHVLLLCPLTQGARQGHRVDGTSLQTLMASDPAELVGFCATVLKTFDSSS